MYKKSTLLLLLIAVLFTACQDKKEEDCVAPAIGHNLIGTWLVEVDLGPLGKDGGFTANFKSNGEVIDQDDIFYIGIDLGDDARVLISDTKAGA